MTAEFSFSTKTKKIFVHGITKTLKKKKLKIQKRKSLFQVLICTFQK
jgi:hypothetical protein